MRCPTLHSFVRLPLSLLTRLAGRFHATLSFESPLSISCTICNYFTALGYYPFNLLLFTLFASRSDGWQHCADLMRYQLALLLLFVLYVLWRMTLSTAERRVRDSSLLLLVALQLWVDWHGWHASKQAVANFQSWAESDSEEWSSGRHTAVDHSAHSHHHSPIQPPPHTSTTAWPSYPYQLGVQCGVGFSIHLVRLALVNVAFTAAVALAFVLRVASEWVSDEKKDRVWAVWDGAVDWVERQWSQLRRRASRVKRRYQRQQRHAAVAGWPHDADSDFEADEEDEMDEMDEEEGLHKQLDGRPGMRATDKLLP